MTNTLEVKQFLIELQDSVCSTLELEEDSASFVFDKWLKRDLGYGTSAVIEQGSVFEKGGVNFSHVFGKSLPDSATEKRPELKGVAFEVLGVSIVIHPKNPFIPTSHANFRFFITTSDKKKPVWWFGGGMDLTPYYGFTEDCIYWHQLAKEACDPFGNELYPRYKKCCDEYFYLAHRKEHRGIGGLFFDDVNNGDFKHCFNFLKSVARNYLKAYQGIVNKRKMTAYSERQRAFQRYRRGRYTEFNLLYDRGTAFGLQTGGRVESILMSLPPEVAWSYNWHPVVGSEEEKLYTDFLPPRDWITE